MTIDNTRKLTRRPTHPGEILREDFMPDYGLTAGELAKALGVSRQTIYQLLNEKRSLSASLAVRLARFFGNTPEFWLNLQRGVDIWEAENELGAVELDHDDQ